MNRLIVLLAGCATGWLVAAGASAAPSGQPPATAIAHGGLRMDLGDDPTATRATHPTTAKKAPPDAAPGPARLPEAAPAPVGTAPPVVAAPPVDAIGHVNSAESPVPAALPPREPGLPTAQTGDAPASFIAPESGNAGVSYMISADAGALDALLDAWPWVLLMVLVLAGVAVAARRSRLKAKAKARLPARRARRSTGA